MSWHTIFCLITGFIVAKGVRSGIETAVLRLMPALLIMLFALVIYSAIEANFLQGLKFMLYPNFEIVTWNTVLIAMGQAFFSLSIGMGAIMAYGAYMPEKQLIGKTVLTIILLDTFVALAAGIAIFPIVFSNASLEVTAGPGLLFETLPVAFYSLPYGNLFSIIFFLLISIAALSSSISLLEPFTAWMEEKKKYTRSIIVVFLGSLIWFLGLASILSFNIWSDVKLFGLNFLELLDYLTNNLMLPLGGFFVVLLMGWFLPYDLLKQNLNFNEFSFKIFYFFLRYVCTSSIVLIFLYSIF